MNIPQPIPIGYDVRYDELTPTIKLPGHVRLVCSVAKCMVSGPSCGHIIWRGYTRFEFSNTPANALAYLSDEVPQSERGGFDPDNPPKSASLYAFRLIPLCFEHGSPIGKGIDVRHYFGLSDDDPVIEEPGDVFVSLGYDAAAYTHYEANPDNEQSTGGAYLGCSPLSCCPLAHDWPVNEWCLLPTLELALSAAADFSRDESEPGPYFAVEVLRHPDPIRLDEFATP